jgi:hypothetical protein
MRTPVARENQLIRRLLLTGRQPAGSPLPGLGGPCGNDHFSQDSSRPRARPATSSSPGLPRYIFTSSARPPRTFTDSPGSCGSSRETSSITVVSAGKRPNHPATAPASWPGKIQRTSRLRTPARSRLSGCAAVIVLRS